MATKIANIMGDKVMIGIRATKDEAPAILEQLELMGITGETGHLSRGVFNKGEGADLPKEEPVYEPFTDRKGYCAKCGTYNFILNDGKDDYTIHKYMKLPCATCGEDTNQRITRIA